MYYLGIDLGGTNIVAGVVDENYKIIAKESCKTNVPRPEEDICDDMALVAKRHLQPLSLQMTIFLSLVLVFPVLLTAKQV